MLRSTGESVVVTDNIVTVLSVSKTYTVFWITSTHTHMHAYTHTHTCTYTHSHSQRKAKPMTAMRKIAIVAQ